MARVSGIAIDFGTSNIVIYSEGRNIILEEPTVIAVDRVNRDILAIGSEAKRMVGRTPSRIMTVRPLKDGTIEDYELVSYMLKSFVTLAVGKHLFARPHAVLCVPSGVTDIEKRSLLTTMFDAGMRRTSLITRPMAAAIGAEVDMTSPTGVMVVDISAGVTDMAVLTGGKVYMQDCITIGGDRFDEAIVRYMRQKYNLYIGDITAEEIKVNIGSAIQRTNPAYMDVTGRSMLTGLPRTERITSRDVTEAISEPMQKLFECVQGMLEKTPVELAFDIYQNGIILSGSTVKMFGFCEAMADALRVVCKCSEQPEYAITNGCARVMENMADYSQFLDSGRRRSLLHG